MKLEFSRQIFDKSSDIKLKENPSSGSRVVACGDVQTDRHKEANSRFFEVFHTRLKILKLIKMSSTCAEFFLYGNERAMETKIWKNSAGAIKTSGGAFVLPVVLFYWSLDFIRSPLYTHI